MKTVIVAAALLAVSSFAYAADNGGKDKNDGDRTGSIVNTDRFDPPDDNTIESCKSAPADDANCQNARSAR